MEDIRYYPLIAMDTEGQEFQAMTPAHDENTVRGHHRLWLTEIVPNSFRLGAMDKPSAARVEAFRLHCPKCSSVLMPISRITPERPFPLYVCRCCR